MKKKWAKKKKPRQLQDLLIPHAKITYRSLPQKYCKRIETIWKRSLTGKWMMRYTFNCVHSPLNVSRYALSCFLFASHGTEHISSRFGFILFSIRCYIYVYMYIFAIVALVRFFSFSICCFLLLRFTFRFDYTIFGLYLLVIEFVFDEYVVFIEIHF